MRLLTLSIFIFIYVASFAQSNTPALWSTTVGPDIQWTYLSADGTLIVAKKDTTIVKRNVVMTVPHTVITTTDTLKSESDSLVTRIDVVECSMLSGIDQKNGAIKWKFKTLGVTSGPDPISNYTYLQLRDVLLTIFDPANGQVIIDGAAEHITAVFKYGFLNESGHLWLDAAIDYGRGLSLFDLSTGKKLWTRYDYFGLHDQTNIVVAKVVNLGTKGGTRQSLLCPPINDSKDYMIFAAGDKGDYNDLYKVFIKSGDIVWRNQITESNRNELVYHLLSSQADTTFFRLIKGKKNFYYVRPKSMTAWNYDNGKSKWTFPVKTNSKVGEIIYDKRGLILASVSGDADEPLSFGRIRLVSDSMGVELWKEPLSFDGGISKYQYTPKGLAIVTENPQMALVPGLAGCYFNFIDVEHGQYNLKEPLRLRGKIRNLQTVPNGVYYSTDRTLNIIGFDGKELLDIPLTGTMQIEDSTKAWFYHDQNLYEIDKTTAVKRLINKVKIDFQGNDSPAHMEIRKDGVILYSDQNIVFINFDGTTRYLIHYKPISNLVDKLQLGEFFKKPSETEGLILPETTSSAFVVFLKTGTSGKLSIVGKDSGETLSTIDLENSEIPVHHVDSRTGVLFLRSTSDNTVKAYQVR